MWCWNARIIKKNFLGYSRTNWPVPYYVFWTAGANYEPPLTNVFTMQWFLTLFATCLPNSTALRVWDSILLEGSELLFRTALAIWEKLQEWVLRLLWCSFFFLHIDINQASFLFCLPKTDVRMEYHRYNPLMAKLMKNSRNIFSF